MNGRTIRFDAFEADLTARELSKRGVRLKLQDQPFQVLAALLEKPGEVVTREELQQRIWGDDTFVDFDKSLSAAVNKVRQALDDSRTRPRFIETVPKVGYRFIGAVEAAPQPEAAVVSSEPRRAPKATIALAALIVVSLAIALANLRRGDSPQVAAQRPPVPLTSYPGEERQPTFSPDGGQVAFAWRQQSRDDFDIWVKVIGSEDPLQLTSSPADEMSPAWSPDGSSIAFLRHRQGGVADVLLIPPLGGATRKVAEVDSHPTLAISLDWSPDGRSLLTYRKGSKGEPGALIAISIDTGEKRTLFSAPGSALNAARPAYSPDGTNIAFFLGNALDPSLAVLAIGREKPRLVGKATRVEKGSGLDWIPDGSGMVAGRPLSIFPMTGGDVTAVPGVGPGDENPAVSSGAHRLAYAAVRSTSIGIWRLDVLRRAEPPQAFAPSTLADVNPQVSPDGSRVAFTSTRSGNIAI